MEMLEEIKAELEKVSEITNVEILTHEYNNFNYLKVEGPYDGCPGSEHPVTKLIKNIAAKYGKETDGWGWLYQTERVHSFGSSKSKINLPILPSLKSLRM